MKSFILIAVLAALTVSNAASISDEASVFEVGSFGRTGEVTLHDQWYYRDTNGNNTVAFDIEYLGSATTRITGVRVFFPPAITVPGTLGSRNVSIRLVTAPGRELASRVIIFGLV